MNVTLVDIQSIQADWLAEQHLSLDILRLDKLHSIVSGNKWFKLKYYFEHADKTGKSTIATFGGAWSNHIIATAFAARQKGFNSVGFIRGEKPLVLSYTLALAEEYGMRLYFVSREQYRQKNLLIEAYHNKDWLWINEGGYGTDGAKGAGEILKLIDASSYTHIIAAVGTGTMLAGLINSCQRIQKVIGINTTKGNYEIEQKILDLIETTRGAFDIKHEYHFGGYGKHPLELIEYINKVYFAYNVPLDIVYTGKTFYAIEDMAKNGLFAPQSKLLMIHSGGLQGNKSLSSKVLAF